LVINSYGVYITYYLADSKGGSARFDSSGIVWSYNYPLFGSISY